MSVMLILGFPTCFGSRLKENGACRFVAQLSCLGGLEAVPSKQLVNSLKVHLSTKGLFLP